MIKTEIRQTEKGHQVGFTIGVQTFFLKEQLPEDGMTSLVYAKWYETQLKLAFKNLSLKKDLCGAVSSLSVKEILDYECHSHWLAGWISFSWGQELIAWLIAKKVSYKYKRYFSSLESLKRISNDLKVKN